ncbi:MAG: hypothetical protein MUD10_00610 [Candidatus Pacebacteria bacterium]|jgi:hypothetical protein|nr:hypothetical protein [Candidatus Paceibacterota bacterium]
MENPIHSEGSEINPLPETFEVEFLNGRAGEISSAMVNMGGFHFERSRCDEEGVVSFEGSRSDGTKIKIEIQKGFDYKSPAKIAEESSKE